MTQYKYLSYIFTSLIFNNYHYHSNNFIFYLFIYFFVIYWHNFIALLLFFMNTFKFLLNHHFNTISSISYERKKNIKMCITVNSWTLCMLIFNQNYVHYSCQILSVTFLFKYGKCRPIFYWNNISLVYILK